jgi:hypothetical protein
MSQRVFDGVVVAKGASVKFEVGVELVITCAKTFVWRLEPAMDSSTIPKIGSRIFVMEVLFSLNIVRKEGKNANE